MEEDEYGDNADPGADDNMDAGVRQDVIWVMVVRMKKRTMMEIVSTMEMMTQLKSSLETVTTPGGEGATTEVAVDAVDEVSQASTGTTPSTTPKPKKDKASLIMP